LLKLLLFLCLLKAFAAKYAGGDVVKAADRLRAGEKAPTVLKDLFKETIVAKPKRAIRAGNEREQKVRNYLNSKLQNFLGQVEKTEKQINKSGRFLGEQ
jgi:hypothetical protein